MFIINLLYVNNIDTPTWLIFVLAVCMSIAFSLLGLAVFKKLFPKLQSKASNDFISISLSTVGLFSSVLISLIAVNTWTFYVNVEQIVNSEGHAIEDLYRSVQGLPEPTQGILMSDIKQYIDVVTKEEWPDMNAGKMVTDKGRLILLQSNTTLLKFNTTDPVMANIQSKAMDNLSSLFDARRDRILSTKDHVPVVIWLVMFLSAFLTVAVSYLYTAESVAMHMISTGFITASLAATLFLVVIFGHPFQGNLRIEPVTFTNFQEQNLK